MKTVQPEVIGICEICDREMVEGPSCDEHHWVPRLKGGKNGPVSIIHRICHNKLHSIWSENELARTYNRAEVIKSDPEMQKFIQWLKNKPADFYTSTRLSNSKKRR